MNPTEGQVSGAGAAQPSVPGDKAAQAKKTAPKDAAARAAEQAAAAPIKKAGEQPASPQAASDEAIAGAMHGVSDAVAAPAQPKGNVKKLAAKFEQLSQANAPASPIVRSAAAPPPAVVPKALPPAVPPRAQPPAPPPISSSTSSLTSASSSSLASPASSATSTSSFSASDSGTSVSKPLPRLLPEEEDKKGKRPVRAPPRQFSPSGEASPLLAAAPVTEPHETLGTAGVPTEAAPAEQKKNMAFKIWRQVAKLPKPIVGFVTGLAISRSKMGTEGKAEQYPRELIQKLPPKLFATLPAQMVKNLLPAEIQTLSNPQIQALGSNVTLVADHLTSSQKNALTPEQQVSITENKASIARDAIEREAFELMSQGRTWDAARLKTAWMPVDAIESNRLNTVVLGLNANAPSHAIMSTLGDTFGFGRGQFEGNMVSVRNQHAQYTTPEGAVDYTKLIAANLDADKQHILFSDDTVMTRMTLEALSKVLQQNEAPQSPEAVQNILDQLRIATKELYVQYDRDNREKGRGTGGTIKAMVRDCPDPQMRYAFNPPSGDGCGGSMRCAVFGDMFYGEANREILLKAVVDNVAITHTHPVGIVGGLCVGLMSAYAKEDVPFYQWMDKMLADTAVGGAAYNYALATIPNAKENKAAFDKAWADATNTVNLQKLLRMPPEGEHRGTYNTSAFPDTLDGRQAYARQLAKLETKSRSDDSPAEFAPPIEVDSHGNITKNKRIEGDAPNCVKWTHTHPLASIGLGGWPARNGDDSAMLPYDYLMLTVANFAQAKGLDIQTLTPSQFRSEFAKLSEAEQRKIFDEFLKKACWHEGDSDTTGTIAFGIWGAFMGTAGVPPEICQQVTSNVFH